LDADCGRVILKRQERSVNEYSTLSQTAPLETVPALTTRTALLVEDEALVAMVAEESLRIIGFEPISVRTGAEALAVLDQEQVPALAVIDVGLPDVRGDDLARRVRARVPAMPIIVASGYDGAELKQRFVGDLAVAVLSKPYTDRDLARAVLSLGLEVIEEPI
jgi:CheY-like chemotaxis protein